MPLASLRVRRMCLAVFVVWVVLSGGAAALPAAAQDGHRPPPNNDTKLRLLELEREQSELRRQLPGLAGPIALVATGGGFIAASGVVALGSWLIAGASYLGSQDGGSDDPPYERPTRTLIRCGVAAAAGGAIVAGGAVWLGRRVQQRRAYAPAARELRQRRKELLQRTSMLPTVGANHAGLVLATSF